MFVGCLTSQQHASESQGRICLDASTCCHTVTEAEDQTCYLIQSQYADTGLTCPSADPVTPGAWRGTSRVPVFESLSFSFSSKWHHSARKGYTRSVPFLCGLPKVALETVPMFVWLNTDRSRPRRVECRPLPFSTPLSFRRSVLWFSDLSMFRKFLKPLSTSALPSCRPGVISAVLACLPARSFPLTPACPGQ